MSQPANEEPKPPVFRSWRGWYALVLGVLAIQIVMYLVITRIFA